jgi:hypothetical protein
LCALLFHIGDFDRERAGRVLLAGFLAGDAEVGDARDGNGTRSAVRAAPSSVATPSGCDRYRASVTFVIVDNQKPSLCGYGFR